MSGLQMPLADVVSNLKEILGDDIQRTDVVQPQPSKIQNIYFRMLQEFGFSDTMLQVDHFHANDPAYTELLANTRQGDKLVAILRYYFKKINYVDPSNPTQFGLFDILEPEPKRTRGFLVAMINFWLYCNSNIHHVEEIRDRVMEKVQKGQEMLKEINKTNERIQAIQKKNAENAMKMDQFEQEIRQLEETIEELTELTSKEKSHVDALKTEVHDVKAVGAKLDSQINELAKKEEALKTILKNAEGMGELVQEFEQLKATLEEKKNYEIDLNSKSTKKEEMKKDLTSFTDHLNIVVQRVEKLREVESDIKEISRNLSMQQGEVDSMESRVSTWKEKVKDIKEALAKDENKWKKKKTMKESELQSLDTEYKDAAQHLNEDEIASNDLLSKISQSKQDMAKLESKFEQLQMLAQERKKEIAIWANQECKRIKAQMDKIAQAKEKLYK